ncbi:hypothetical protein [Reyranella sp. CPCC 100927]|uniref:hypothetical protein n=1 Tax=Reyranella sp. CPCC 100927 TaxID=2599616 RepID=UPI0011B55C5C|nr:hypothetical protein [Reyranella sp. CPCC 100927]TWS96313.1 hypothetical protein FQU96_39195 [Reyranella sp. CPCC 100927]
MKKQTRKATPRSAGSLAVRAIGAVITLSTVLTMMAAPSVAQTVKSCEELGGTPTTSMPGCNLKAGTMPFEATFTGKFEKTIRHSAPGAVFKITSRFDRPVKINSAQVYVYDKAGKQVTFIIGDRKPIYLQDSTAGLIEIAPGETKTFVHSVRQEHLPSDMGALEVAFLAWTTMDGKTTFQLQLDSRQFEVRPKGGWK